MINGVNAQADAQSVGGEPAGGNSEMHRTGPRMPRRRFAQNDAMSEEVSTGHPTLNSITSRIAKAANRSELLAVSQSIQHLPEHWQREQAGRIVKRKIIEFKQR